MLGRIVDTMRTLDGNTMLLTGYRKEIFRPKCNPSFQSVHCFAYLNEDIREVLPYLNTVLGGTGYTHDPPSVTFQLHGRLITLHSNKIAINALRDEGEADKVLEWLKYKSMKHGEAKSDRTNIWSGNQASDS